MKRIILSLIILFACNSIAEAQTYCYRSAYRVNKDTGVKEEQYHSLSYYTFNSNKSFCYLSDENGMAANSSNNRFGMNLTRTKGWGEYRYVKTENDVHIYKGTVESYAMVYGSGYELYETQDTYLYFSSDYSKLNKWTNDAKNHGNSGYGAGAAIGRAMVENATGTKPSQFVYVYERVSAPGQASAPTQMY